MKCNTLFFLIFISICICLVTKNAESRAVQNNIHGDAIVTFWPTPTPEEKLTNTEDENKPGWMRQQLLKFGKVASRVGNAMGAHATKITSAVDKVCEIVKTVIPLLAAVCHVGQFKFCSATNGASDNLNEALSPASLDLNVPD